MFVALLFIGPLGSAMLSVMFSNVSRMVRSSEERRVADLEAESMSPMSDASERPRRRSALVFERHGSFIGRVATAIKVRKGFNYILHVFLCSNMCCGGGNVGMVVGRRVFRNRLCCPVN